MANGGPRPGAGAPKGNRNRAKKQPPDAPDVHSPRPTFQTAHEFAIWAMNAPDAEVPMELKIRTMQVLAPLEAKQPKPDAALAASEPGSKYAPRKVRGFGVVSGGRS